MIKRVQYYVRQFSLANLNENYELIATDDSNKEGISQSENFLFYQTYKKLKSLELENSNNENAKETEKNILKDIISIETGGGATKEMNERLEYILKNGVKLEDTKYLFLDVLLSGSQHKNVKQYFVNEKYYEALKEIITLNKIPKETVTAKFLTAVALMTTSCNLIDLDLENLDICIIEDIEYETEPREIVYNAEYKPTDEEKEEVSKMYEIIEYSHQCSVERAKAKERMAAKENNTIPHKKKDNGQYTESQWRKQGRRVKLDEIANPSSRHFVRKDTYKWYGYYKEEQTDPIPEDCNLDLIKVSRVTTGIDFVKAKKPIPINFADGTGIITGKLAKQIKSQLGEIHEGYQIRLPFIKSFSVVVPEFTVWIKSEYKNCCKQDEKGYYILDLFNKKHYIDKIDLIITKSCFKAFLEKSEECKNIQGCLFKDFDEYNEFLIKYDFDKLGIANYVHTPKSKYTEITYQHLLALNIDNPAILTAFASKEIALINKVLNVYNGTEELDEDNIKFILAFLNILRDINKKDENKEDSNNKFEDYAIQMISLNSQTIFDNHVRNKILQRIKILINKMRLGKILMPCNYYYATCHIPSLMNWIVNRDIDKFKKIVPQNRVFMGNMQGKCVAIRNPITAPSEVGLLEFGKDYCQYTENLKHIIQFGEGDYMMRMNLDFDGDKICLFDSKTNYRNMNFDFLHMYEDKTIGGIPALNYYKDKYDEALYKINSNVEEPIYLTDFIRKLPPQVNYNDKVTATPKEFTLENVVDFIINSDDKTGSITNKATQVSNRALAEKDYEKYEYEIMYGKYLQGLQIDASKSQLEVEIDDIYNFLYYKRAKFLYSNYGGNKNSYDNKITSPLDYFAEIIMEDYAEYVDELINTNTKIRKSSQVIINTTALLKNYNINFDYTNEYIKYLKPIYLEFKEKFQEINEKYENINKYSKSDESKELRKAKRKEYSDLFEATRDKVFALFNKKNKDNWKKAASLIANAVTTIAYGLSKTNSKEDKEWRWEDNYTFAWVFGDCLLYNLWINQSKENPYISVTFGDENSYDFKLLDNYFSVELLEDFIPQESIEEIKEFTISKKLLEKKESEEVKETIEIKSRHCMGLPSGLTTKDILENRLAKGSIYKLKENKGYIQIWDDEGFVIGITGDDVRNYLEKEIVITDISNIKNKSLDIDFKIVA